MPFGEKTAIVTGAAQGIGAAYAAALATAGFAVVVSDINDTTATTNQIKAQGGRVLGVLGDMSEKKSIDAMVAEVIRAFGRIDVLVNNAAIFGQLVRKPFTEIDSSEWDHLMAVNVRGVFECVKAIVPEMRRRRYGKIINIASNTVFKGTPMMLHYVASKGAVIAMTRSLARELADDGIRVNAIAPGLVMSDSVRKNPAFTQQVIDVAIASNAIRREQMPEDIVGTLLFLASADSDFLTGQTIVVDGGAIMY